MVRSDGSVQRPACGTEGAPQAQQVIDRWHVLKNLREAVERFLNRTQMQRNELVGPSQEISPRQKRTNSERALSEGARLRRLALYDQVVELYKQGGSILGIARQLQIGHQTVRKFVKAPSFPERSKTPRTKSALDPYRPYLEKRWQQGCHATSQLWKEVQAQGFTGSWMMVYRWVQLQEAASGVPSQTSHHAQGAPKLGAPRHLAWLIIREPERLEKQEQQTLSFIRQDKNVDLAYGLVQQFVTMVKERSAKPLDTWLLNCQTSGISELDNFAEATAKGGFRSSSRVDPLLQQRTCGRKNQ